MIQQKYIYINTKLIISPAHTKCSAVDCGFFHMDAFAMYINVSFKKYCGIFYTCLYEITF